VSAPLSVKGLHKHFGGPRAVDGVDLKVAAGERRAVIGPNGAGKTTLFNLVTGHLRPDAGLVTFDGVDITGLPTSLIARAGIGRSFQITSIFGPDGARERPAGHHRPAPRDRAPIRSRRRPAR
jgi:branched-chain amino acid transport system ATP-binding protein